MSRKLEISKSLKILLTLNIIQIIAVLIVLFYRLYLGNWCLDERYVNEYVLFLLIISSAVVVTLFTFKISHAILIMNAQSGVLLNNVEQLGTLNKAMRAQRHDFINHLQVVHGLMEMSEFDEANKYIHQVFVDIQNISRYLRTSIPAVNALLQAKLLSCEKKSIVAYMMITTQLKDLEVPAWELCRVLGNIIDNAMDALIAKEQPKQISIKFGEDKDFFSFSIENNGPKIPEDLIHKIFETGFTTKNEKGEGMGLAIVKEIVEGYMGTVSLKSIEDCTSFEILIPKTLKHPN